MKKTLFLALLATLSFSALAGGKRPTLTQDQRQRIMDKIVAVIEEETGAECSDFAYTYGIKISEWTVAGEKVSKCEGVKVKQKLDGQDNINKLKIVF